MPKNSHRWPLILGAIVAALASCPAAGSAPEAPADDLAAHRAVDAITWSHRLRPEGTPGGRPAFDAAVVLDEYRKINALETLFGRTIGKAEVQAEIDRIARGSKMPERLREIQAALGDDPDRFGEIVARPLLADRLLRGYAAARGLDFDAWWRKTAPTMRPVAPAPLEGLAPAAATDASCAPGTWSPMLASYPPAGSDAVTAWTGSELLLWVPSPTGGIFRYDPIADSWTATRVPGEPAFRSGGVGFWTGTELLVAGGSTAGSSTLPPLVFFNPSTNSWRTGAAPPAGSVRRSLMSVVWTGTGVILWGGQELQSQQALTTGLRYTLGSDTWSTTSTAGAPSARYRHAAVWTGTRMVVWGGSVDFNDETDTGGRYDPVADTWTATKLQGAPAARTQMSSVWTGTKLIVWAGRDCDIDGLCTDLGDGGRYDPVADTWANMANNGPTARHDAPAVWTGSAMIVYGGFAEGEESLPPNGARYVESTNHWFDLPPTGGPGSRFTHSLVWTGSEAIVWGGQNGSYELDTGARYKASTDSWSPTHPSNRPAPRAGHSAVWTGSELLIWGGTVSGTLDAPGGRYDPALDAWTPMASANQPNPSRYRHTAVWTGNEMMVWGGKDVAEATPLASGGRYALASNTWALIPDAGGPAPRVDHSAVWTGSRMLIWGGRVDTQFPPTYFGDGTSYDPAAGSWTPLPSSGAPTARAKHVAVWTGTDMLVSGGLSESSWETTGARYRPGTGAWTPITLSWIGGEVFDPVWTGQDLIELGGLPLSGALYNPPDDGWRAVPAVGLPSGGGNPPAGIERACDRLYWIGSTDQPNASHALGSATWSPVAKNPSQMWISQARDVVGIGSRVVVWNGSVGETYCACAAPAPPPPTVAIYFGEGGQRERLGWQTSPFATNYDLVRGSLGTLRATAGNFTSATNACLANDVVSPTWLDADSVPASGFWYLVRGAVGAAAGGYDSGSPRQVGLRDAEIAASGVACP